MVVVTSWFLQKPRFTPRLPGGLEVGVRVELVLLITTTSSGAPASSVPGAETSTRGFSGADTMADGTGGAGIVLAGTVGAGEMVSGTRGSLGTVEGEAFSPVVAAPTPFGSSTTFASSAFCSILPFNTFLFDSSLKGAVFAGVACKMQFVRPCSHHYLLLSHHQPFFGSYVPQKG